MKATSISCITMNYPSEGSMLIEWTDGSSLMIPKNSDIKDVELAIGIHNRWYAETHLSDCITEPTEEDYEYADSMFNL